MLKKFNLKFDVKEPETTSENANIPEFKVGEEVYYRPRNQRNKNQIHPGKIARIKTDAFGFKFYEVVATQAKRPNKFYVHGLTMGDIFKIEEIEGKNGKTKV